MIPLTARKPAAYRCVEVYTDQYPNESHIVMWSKYRNKFIEPITNLAALPVIGNITHWQYYESKSGSIY